MFWKVKTYQRKEYGNWNENALDGEDTTEKKKMYRKNGDTKNVILVILRDGEDTKKKIGQKNRKKKEKGRKKKKKEIILLPIKWIFTMLSMVRMQKKWRYKESHISYC